MTRAAMRWGPASICAAVLLVLLGTAHPADGRMTIVYDVAASTQALIGVQSDGTPGLNVGDGLYEQVTGALPADRKVGGLTGGDGSFATPTIRVLASSAIVTLMKEQIGLAGAGMVFIDVGPNYDIGGPDAANLEAAMVEMAATPYPSGGTYAGRVQMYVSRVGDIADPESLPAFWHAMALSGGVWLEAYHGRAQWPPELWLAWPRALRDGLVARGMDPSLIHIIVRGGDMTTVWASWRTGVACELLANGPGAYRIEDHLGFVREFRATFGAAPAPAGPSPVACSPPPVVPEPRATALADVLALGVTGRPLRPSALSASLVRTGRKKVLRVALGSDPLGIAARLGTNATEFWAAANAAVTATGPGINASSPLSAGGVAFLGITPTAAGHIALALSLDGAAVRQAIGPPVDFAATLAAHRARVGSVLRRIVSQPTTWRLQIPLRSALRAGPPPLRLWARVLRRNAAAVPSPVELRLSRAVSRVLVEVGVVTHGRYVRVRRLRITGRRVVIRLRLPSSATIRARLVPEHRARLARR